jgi:hypothetical protein
LLIYVNQNVLVGSFLRLVLKIHIEITPFENENG